MKDLNNKSKFLALVLRHNPAKANIVLSKNGWASVDDLLANTDITEQELDIIVNVKPGEKKRYEYDDDKTYVRAVQGHSIQEIDTEQPVKVPPTVLYHGTSDKTVDIILKQGLKPMNRKHVHLAPDRQTALKVGSRKSGKTVLLQIDTREMVKQDVEFYYAESVNTWLVDFVPPKFITYAD